MSNNSYIIVVLVKDFLGKTSLAFRNVKNECSIFKENYDESGNLIDKDTMIKRIENYK